MTENISSYPSAESGRNREDVRGHNLSVILRTVHTNGEVTRSQLASGTGLNRSTILTLVAELVERGLVLSEEATSASGVGRPSHLVLPSPDVISLVVHTEVDAITVGAVTLGGRVLAKHRDPVHTAPSPEKSVELAAARIEQLRRELPPQARVVGIGVAVPGQVRAADGVVRYAPHLGWNEVPYSAMLGQATGLPVEIDNDASIGCTAEYTFGSARGFNNIVYLFAGSGGIGGGVIIDGARLRGVAGYAGELGHVRISSSTKPDYSGLTGTIEALVQRDELLDALKLFGATDEELQVEAKSKSAKSSVVANLIRGQIDSLSIGLANFVNIFNPNAIILDGFLGTLFDFDEQRLINGIRTASLAASSERLVIRKGKLGSDLLMVGGAELAFNRLLSAPAETELHPIRR